MLEAIKKQNVAIDNAEVAHVGKASVDVDLETARKVLRLIETLNDYDDTQNVYSNVNLTDEVLAGLEKD